MKKNIKKITTCISLLFVSCLAFSSNTLGKFVYGKIGTAWESFFTPFEQVDKVVIVTKDMVENDEDLTSEKLYGEPSTQLITNTLDNGKPNVFGTYFVAGSTTTERNNNFKQIVSNNQYTIESIKNKEFKVHNQSEHDLLVTFNIHYYAPKEFVNSTCLQFAVYNTKKGKIDDPFTSTDERILKGEFFQIGDGDIATFTSGDWSDLKKPFEDPRLPKLVSPDSGDNKLATGTDKDKDTSLKNWLTIRYGGGDNISYNNGSSTIEYCPHNAYINQFIYEPISDSTHCFETQLFWCKSGRDLYYFTGREELNASELSHFIVNSNSSAGYNLNLKRADNVAIDNTCFISAITLTTTPCVEVWDDYVESNN